MGTRLLHATLVEHHDLVGPHYSRESVRNHNDRATRRQLAKGALDERLVLGVGKRRGLIEHHDRRVFKDRAGECHALDLAARKICSAGTEHGIDALWKLGHNVVALSCGEGRTHFVVSGRRLGSAHVIGKCLPEQLVGLEHEGDLVHKLVRIHIANVHTTYEHSTRGNIPKTRNQACAG